MTNFNIRVVESGGDIHIYTEATSINISNDKIEIDYRDCCREEHATHSTDLANEIIIKPTR